ncbi:MULTISPECIES: MucR family transcriptional regulator [Paraburkholderia]|uniref:MucR family transcriptional regulator n=1 Tax=Paraburkholderia madseniana TaxID=2599607 RepID=A0A6N6WIV2_9BURK|nr:MULTISPECIES: MucR family transcriptional regulator [Paraburkholderia]KAE8759891.1 MucR family transcriptional regulator [Paraburkholderia madseniana]MCX4169810.1 MucR family transcriptional regulator [Paraburkholderia madseniana]MDQ6457822.1 MucR family transcriptional regulator [Paraburkholderia madseniana]NPT64818.1 MucR family transcriptional regulator [Paraburkholderia madseniana]
MTQDVNLIELTAEIVASFVSCNPLPAADLPEFIWSTYAALAALHTTSVPAARQRAAVPIEESVRDDYLVCLEDGRKLKSLKRYLQRHFAMTPDEYRAKWGLPADYPMVAPAYSALRSSIAKRHPAGAIKPRRGA